MTEHNEVHRDGQCEPDSFEPRSLVEIMTFLRNLEVDPTVVRPTDIDLLYEAMFTFPWSDPETEELRTDLLRTMGSESGRDLCKRHSPMRCCSDGVLDDDLESSLGRLTAAVILVLRHVDLNPDGFSLDLSITGDRRLCARPMDDAGRSSSDAPRSLC